MSGSSIGSCRRLLPDDGQEEIPREELRTNRPVKNRFWGCECFGGEVVRNAASGSWSRVRPRAPGTHVRRPLSEPCGNPWVHFADWNQRRDRTFHPWRSKYIHRRYSCRFCVLWVSSCPLAWMDL